MSIRLHHCVMASLLAICTVLVASACSSSSDDDAVGDDSDRGGSSDSEGGESNDAGRGGASGDTGGSAGDDSGEAGEGGEGGRAGSGGRPAMAGAGGEGTGGFGTCKPSGTSTEISLASDAQKACREARIRADIRDQGPDPSFTCCAVSNTVDKYSVDVTGVTNDGTGDHLTLVVPATAPLGMQSLTITCTGSVLDTLDFEVVEGVAPIVNSADTAIAATGVMHINGQHLRGVTRVTAASADPAVVPATCTPTAAATDTAVSCNFTSISPGSYSLFVQVGDCGYAVNAPQFTVSTAP